MFQESQNIPDAKKTEIFEIIFTTLTKLTKQSLQNSDVSLQETLLSTIDEVCQIKIDATVLPTIIILIYFIMVPTSKHPLLAVNKMFKLAKKNNTNTTQLFKQYKSTICETIAHLCCVNQTLANYDLQTSLSKISGTLEFYSSKDFVTREYQNLLPFFVYKSIKSPSVKILIEQMAVMSDLDLSELLTASYGNIFLYVFLNETKENFQSATCYLENTTGLSGPHLRKLNLSVILNELLLNFHERREQVVLTLGLLAREDKHTGDLQDYLQTRFLGFLQHFDLKLMGKNEKKKAILLSLADLFRFMGSAHIGPLRFKIIAMLRTTDYGDFPELSCQLWDVFVRCCDVGSLGGQLATIFVSLLPLLDVCPQKINDIFAYLVVENEKFNKEFIKDLFFIDDARIDYRTSAVIGKYVDMFGGLPLKERLQLFKKYLDHETIEVRVESLKHLKALMETNREELDRMILGFNGIDPVIVDLIDILTLGCREKDKTLRLASGGVIGELGAVEPAHLPRRYAENSRFFTFFMDDDGFIVNTLGELIKALQVEKNTVVS